jgi:hypothetical protein
MTLEQLTGMGLSQEDCEYLLKQWEDREAVHKAAADELRAELESPFRAAGLIPGESGDGLPDGDGFLTGFKMQHNIKGERKCL